MDPDPDPTLDGDLDLTLVVTDFKEAKINHFLFIITLLDVV